MSLAKDLYPEHEVKKLNRAEQIDTNRVFILNRE